MRRVLGILTLVVLLCCNAAAAEPMLVTRATRDLNGDGKADRISLWLTQGKKYNDTEFWEGAGEKYEGHFIFLVEITGRKPVTNELNRLFYPQYAQEQPMFFWCSKRWEIVFADYNHDGWVDFNLGQYASGVTCAFRLFTVSPEGRVSELPVQGQTDGFLGPVRTHSTAGIEATHEGFTHAYYSRLMGTEVRDWYRWDKDKRLFVLVKQAMLDRRPEPEAGTYRR